MDVRPHKYAHWYCDDNCDCEPGCDMDYDNMMCEKPMPYKTKMYPTESLMDRLMCMIGNKVIFSVDAPLIKRRQTFCGILCYIGCDFIVVSVCICRRPLSLHVPIDMIRYISPY